MIFSDRTKNVLVLPAEKRVKPEETGVKVH